MKKEDIFNLAKRVRDKDTLLILSKLQKELSVGPDDNVFWSDAQFYDNKSWLYLQNSDGTIKDVCLCPRLNRRKSPKRIKIHKNYQAIIADLEEAKENKLLEQENSSEIKDNKPKKVYIKFIEKNGVKKKYRIPEEIFLRLKAEGKI